MFYVPFDIRSTNDIVAEVYISAACFIKINK